MPVHAVAHSCIPVPLLQGSGQGGLCRGGQGITHCAEPGGQQVHQAGHDGVEADCAEVVADRVQVVAPVAAVVHALHLLPPHGCMGAHGVCQPGAGRLGPMIAVLCRALQVVQTVFCVRMLRWYVLSLAHVLSVAC